jgi:hypothetical protein
MRVLSHRVSVLISGVALLSAVAVSTAVADEAKAPAGHHKVVIQVSDGDATGHKIALNNVVNMQKMIGVDNVTIEVVAYGPGLAILTKQSPEAARVKSLAVQNITFSACGNTMKNVEKQTGKAPELTEGVRVVPGGVVRIMELQETGYSYIRP